MLIADLSGQGFLGLCAAVTRHFVFSVVTSYQSYDLPPSHKHWQLTSSSSFCAIVGTGKETQLAMWKRGLCFLLKYIIHSTFCRLNYSCAPSTQYTIQTELSAAVQVRAKLWNCHCGARADPRLSAGQGLNTKHCLKHGAILLSKILILFF